MDMRSSLCATAVSKDVCILDAQRHATRYCAELAIVARIESGAGALMDDFL